MKTRYDPSFAKINKRKKARAKSKTKQIKSKLFPCRGNCLPDYFRNAETLEKTSDLLDVCVRGDDVNNRYNAEAIERMVRARVIRFCRADKTLPELPNRDLQDWQVWFTKVKQGKQGAIGDELKLCTTSTILEFFHISKTSLYRKLGKDITCHPIDRKKGSRIWIDANEVLRAGYPLRTGKTLPP